MTKRIRMLVTKRGSENGITNQEYLAGQVYEMAEGLADVFLKRGLAEEDKMLAGPPETKDVPQAEAEAAPVKVDKRFKRRAR